MPQSLGFRPEELDAGADSLHLPSPRQQPLVDLEALGLTSRLLGLEAALCHGLFVLSDPLLQRTTLREQRGQSFLLHSGRAQANICLLEFEGDHLPSFPIVAKPFGNLLVLPALFAQLLQLLVEPVEVFGTCAWRPQLLHPTAQLFLHLVGIDPKTGGCGIEMGLDVTQGRQIGKLVERKAEDRPIDPRVNTVGDRFDKNLSRLRSLWTLDRHLATADSVGALDHPPFATLSKHQPPHSRVSARRLVEPFAAAATGKSVQHVTDQ